MALISSSLTLMILGMSQTSRYVPLSILYCPLLPSLEALTNPCISSFFLTIYSRRPLLFPSFYDLLQLKAPVRHLTYAPEGRLLSVSDAHGNLRLIDLKSKETVDVLTVLPEIKSNEVLNRTQRLPTTWSPDGSLLAMPGVVCLHSLLLFRMCL